MKDRKKENTDMNNHGSASMANPFVYGDSPLKIFSIHNDERNKMDSQKCTIIQQYSECAPDVTPMHEYPENRKECCRLL